MIKLKGKFNMKNIQLYLALALTLLTLTACGGGGGGGSSQTPPATTYTLTFLSAGNGTLTGAANQTIAQGAIASAVTAVPATGYHFVNWTEAGTEVGVNAVLSIASVSSNHSYTANFVVNTTIKTTAILTISLTGTLPANTGIAGSTFTITLPTNVTPVLNGTAVASGVVTPSGTFIGGTQTPPVYTPATGSAPATLNVTLANSVSSGVTQVGEVTTISLQLANGVTPTANSFLLSGVSVIDATLYNPISGMGASVSNVILQ